MPNVFSFLIEMTPKTERGKAMRSKKLKADPLQFARPTYGHGVVPMKLPYDDCLISMQFYRHFTDSMQQPCDSHAGAAQLFFEPGLQSLCIFLLSQLTI